MKTVLNMAKPKLVPSLEELGVYDTDELNKAIIDSLLTFSFVPDRKLLFERAEALATLAVKLEATQVMIQPQPFFASYLEQALVDKGICPFFPSFEIEEITIPLFKPGQYRTGKQIVEAGLIPSSLYSSNSIQISTLGHRLSRRSINTCKSVGILTVGDLEKASYQQLSEAPACGKKTITELEKFLGRPLFKNKTA